MLDSKREVERNPKRVVEKKRANNTSCWDQGDESLKLARGEVTLTSGKEGLIP